MIYHGTSMTETIWFCPENDQDEIHCIELTKDSEEPFFYVTNCCNTDWEWRFCMNGESNYEMIKHVIIDTMFECEDVVALLDALDCIFTEDFEDIVAWETENKCCNCEHCEHRNCLN